MGRLHKKLELWRAEGLVGPDQVSEILKFEENRKAGRFGRGMVGLSLFAILIGILSIIAANWHAIPGGLKIGVHVGLNFLAAAAAFHGMRKGLLLWREGGTLALYGLTLTLIALIGQVYQLDGKTADALILWMIATAPFLLLLGNSYMTAAPWMAGFLATVFFALEAYVEPLPDLWKAVFLFGTVALLPLALMADGKLSFLEKHRPALAQLCVRTGCILMGVFTTLAIVAGSAIEPDVPSYVFILVALAGYAGMAVHAFLYKAYEGRPEMKAGAIFAAVSLFVMTICIMIKIPSVFAALVFIAYWMMIGWIGQKEGWMRLVSLSIVMIAIRIFGAYVELFGGLMTTGFGLISGGLVMLGLIYASRKLNRRLTQKGEGTA